MSILRCCVPACDRRRGHVLLLLLLLALGSACVSYERRPLDEGEFVRVLEKRSLQSPELRNAGAGYAPDDGLSLKEAEVVALFYNPVVRRARLDAQIPVLAADEAGRWSDPELDLEVLRILESIEKPWIIGSSLAFTIPVSGSLAVEKTLAKAQGKAALVEAWTIEQEMLGELRESWIRWESTRQAVAASRDLLEQLDGVIAVTNRLEEAGELITAESVAFRIAHARARLDLERLAAEQAEAGQEIEARLGLMPGSPIVLQPGHHSSTPPAQQAREALLARNPSVLLRRVEYEAAEEALRLEVRRQYPDIQLGPAYGNEEGEHRLGFGLSLPLPILNANKRAIVEATAAREAARAAWEESIHSAFAAQAALSARLAAARSRQRRLADEVNPAATAQLAEARRLADHGEINALLLLEALTSKREAALELIDAETEVARLESAAAALAPEVSSQIAKLAIQGEE